MKRCNWPIAFLSIIPVALFVVVGSFGAMDGQPERRDIDALGVALLLASALTLGFRLRWPLVTLASVAALVDVYIGIGYPYGPIFLSLVIAIYAASQCSDRFKVRLLALGAFLGFVVASQFAPQNDGPPQLIHLTLVAGWFGVVLAVSEVVRARREQVTAQRESQAAAQRERESEQRLRIAQDLHDVLAHNISLINVQASVALHLLDEQPEQARPALTNIKQASHDALDELRGALDSLRSGDAAPYAPTPAPSPVT